MNLRPYFDRFRQDNLTIWNAVLLIFVCGCIFWMVGLAFAGLWLQNSFSFWGAVIGGSFGIIVGLFEKNPMTNNRAINIVAGFLIIAFCGAFFGTLFSRDSDTKQIATIIGQIGLLVGAFVAIAKLVYDWWQNK